MIWLDRHLYALQLQFFDGWGERLEYFCGKLEQALAGLPDREQDVLRRRYDLDGPVETLEQIARGWKITRERVRQLQAKDLRKLRHPLRITLWGEDIFHATHCVAPHKQSKRFRARPRPLPKSRYIRPQPRPGRRSDFGVGLYENPNDIFLRQFRADFPSPPVPDFQQSLMSQIHNNKDIACVHCKIPFPKRMTMSHGRGGQLTKGMIMVCSACGGAMILGDSDWRPMTREDFIALPPESKQALLKVVAGLKRRLGAGQDWSPYEQTRRG